MTEFTSEYLQSVRMCSYLIEPPASEVVGNLCDHIELLQKRIAELEQELHDVVSDLTWEAKGYDKRPQPPKDGEE